MSGTAIYSAAEKLEEIELELSYRRRVYPRLVADPKSKLTREEARRRTEILEAIRHDYAAAVEANPRAAGLLI